MPYITLQKIITHARSHGFIYNSSEIYEGLQAVYDYAPHGVQLKRNLQAYWWKSMTQLNPAIVGLDASILMAPATWKASGHIDGFRDWMIDNKDSKKRYRVDTLIENSAAQQQKEGKTKEAGFLLQQMHHHLIANDGPALTQLLIKANITCPIAKNTNWTIAKQFNLMFATQIGSIENQSNKIYLRPETAQGIFVNFLNIQKTTRQQIPFGVAQIGKAFRNEIVARQFIFRMREFEQMEMQFFLPPHQEGPWFHYWTTSRQAWYQALGIPQSHLSTHPHEQLAHYASAALDLEYNFPFGKKEIEGIHSRTDFDLRNHTLLSKKKLQYFDPKTNTSYTPYVIETSAGSDRLILMLLCHAFTQTEHNNTLRTYLKFPPPIAPIGAAIFPLLKKEPYISQAKAIFNQLRVDFSLTYDQNGSIGKRYTRQDLIGTPYCITIDPQTLEDQQVTVRNRDTTTQERLPLSQLHQYLANRLSMSTLLQQYTHLQESIPLPTV